MNRLRCANGPEEPLFHGIEHGDGGRWWQVGHTTNLQRAGRSQGLPVASGLLRWGDDSLSVRSGNPHVFGPFRVQGHPSMPQAPTPLVEFCAPGTGPYTRSNAKRGGHYFECKQCRSGESLVPAQIRGWCKPRK